jgi:hypothetical protein
MIIDPVSLAVAGVSTITGLFQSAAADRARQQDHVNQVAFQNATGRFNKWQAGFNQKTTTLNNQYGYWRETVNHNQSLAYTSQLRNYELAKELAQAQRVTETRVSAGTNYVLQSEAIQQQLQERGMQEAVAVQQYRYRALQSSAAYQAAAQEGNTMDRFVAGFARQVGDFETLQAINQQFQNRQYRREQLSAMTTYLNQYNSQQFYEPTEYMDPVAPFPPLPTMLMPAGPSMTGAAPASQMGLNAATSVLGGVNTYLSSAAAIKQLGG